MFKHTPQTHRSAAIRKFVYGAGINDAPYLVGYTDTAGEKHKCPFYSVWASMIERCYSKKLHARRPTYAGCTVAPEWLTFSVFRAWMVTQDWEGKSLDKDLLAPRMKHYGPDTCCFIPKGLNNLLTLRDNGRGAYPLGVSKVNVKGFEYFTAQCSFYGKQKRLGYFKTQDEAAAVYKAAKLAYITELAKQEKNPKIRQALVNIS